ncbi:MAG: hypothetical protein K2X50_04800 [Gammaproteobacteria bacterium]|nr:hypothetical protein [Gammaproteobacteria bacterium]
MVNKRYVVFQVKWTRINPYYNGVPTEFDDELSAMNYMKNTNTHTMGQYMLVDFGQPGNHEGKAIDINF